MAYRALRQRGLLQPDPAQQLAIERLQSLYRALLHYRPETGLRGWLARFGFAENNGTDAPVGLYLCGPVGRGKSMLMDLFFRSVPIERKRRVHFHAFMLEVHDRIERERRGQTGAPIAKVASDLASEAALLCFDEFQVEDIADAMILERLFTALFDAGVVVVATSNRAPDELYEHGLQRERFLPFIALLKKQLYVLELDSGRDYRLARLQGKRVYHFPLGPEAHDALQRAFAEMTDEAPGESTTLSVKRRLLVVPRSARGVAWFSFADLCANPLGAVDYLAIAKRFAGHRRGDPAPYPAAAQRGPPVQHPDRHALRRADLGGCLGRSAARRNLHRRRRHLRVPTHRLAAAGDAKRRLHRRPPTAVREPT